MLSSQEIHFNIVNQLTLGSYTIRDYELEELDYVINGVVYDIINEATDKPLVKQNDVEKSILRKLLKTQSTFPTKLNNNEWQTTLPQDFSGVSTGDVLVYDTTCASKVIKIEKDKVYKALGDVKYNNTWYKKCDIIVGDSIEDYYGNLVKVDSVIKNATELNEIYYNLYTPSYSIRYSADRDSIKIKSKYSIAKFNLTYAGEFSNNDKINHCIGQTLNFVESIQQYVINRVVLKLSVITDESQQKVINLKTVNIKQ